MLIFISFIIGSLFGMAVMACFAVGNRADEFMPPVNWSGIYCVDAKTRECVAVGKEVK